MQALNYLRDSGEPGILTYYRREALCTLLKRACPSRKLQNASIRLPSRFKAGSTRYRLNGRTGHPVACAKRPNEVTNILTIGGLVERLRVEELDLAQQAPRAALVPVPHLSL